MAGPKPEPKYGSLNGQDGEDVEGCRIPRTKDVWNRPRNPVRGSLKWGLQRLTKWNRLARVVISNRENVRNAREDAIITYADSPLDQIPLYQFATSTAGEQAKVGE